MNIFVCTLFVVVFFIEFLTGNGTVPRLAVLVPELLAGVAVLVVVARLISGNRIALSAKYLILLGILSLVMLVGRWSSIMTFSKKNPYANYASPPRPPFLTRGFR